MMIWPPQPLHLLLLLVVVAVCDALPRSTLQDVYFGAFMGLPNRTDTGTVGQQRTQQAALWEHAAMSNLAELDINNRSDILPNNTLHIKNFNTTTTRQAFEHSVAAFNPVSASPVDAAVGFITTENAQIASLAGALYGVPLLSDWASGDILTDRSLYPTFSRILPHDRQESQAILGLLDRFQWTRVAVIHSTYPEITKMAVEFRSLALGKDKISIAQFKSITPRKDYYSESTFSLQQVPDIVLALDAVVAAKIKVIVLLMTHTEIRFVLHAAKLMQMSRGFAWVGITRFMFDQSLLDGTKNPLTSKMFRGMVGTRYGQDATHQTVLAQKWTQVFAQNQSLLYNIPTPQYAFVRWDALHITAMAYDAMVRLDVMFCNVSSATLATSLPVPKANDAGPGNYSCADLAARGRRGNVLLSLIRSQRYIGTTGITELSTTGEVNKPISFVNAAKTGDELRVVGNFYHDVVTFSVDPSTLWLGPHTTLSAEFENAPIRPKLVWVATGFAIACLSLTSLLICVWFNWRFATTPVVKMSSPNVNYLTLFGLALILYFPIVTAVQEFTSLIENDHVFVRICYGQLWFLSIGFTVAFGSLFAKSYRIHRLFNARSLKTAPRIHDKELFKMVFFLLIPDLIVLLSFTLFEDMQAASERTNSGLVFNEGGAPTIEVLRRCQSTNYGTYFLVILAYKLSLMLMGGMLAYQTRHVQVAALNDSKWLGYAIAHVVFICSIAAPLAFIIDDPTVMFFLMSFGSVAIVIPVLAFMFIPNMFAVYTQDSSRIKRKPSRRDTINGIPIELDEKMETSINCVAIHHQFMSMTRHIASLKKELLRQQSLHAKTQAHIHANTSSAASTLSINLPISLVEEARANKKQPVSLTEETHPPSQTTPSTID